MAFIYGKCKSKSSWMTQELFRNTFRRICTGSGNPKNLHAHCDFFSCVTNWENSAVGGRMWRLLCKTAYKVHVRGNDCNSQSSGGTSSSEDPGFQSACPKPD